MTNEVTRVESYVQDGYVRRKVTFAGGSEEDALTGPHKILRTVLHSADVVSADDSCVTIEVQALKWDLESAQYVSTFVESVQVVVCLPGRVTPLASFTHEMVSGAENTITINLRERLQREGMWNNYRGSLMVIAEREGWASVHAPLIIIV